MRFAELSILTIALAMAGPAHAQSPRQKAQAGAAATLSALPATGKARNCLNLRNVQETKPVGDRIIMLREGARWYRSDLPGRCTADDTTAFVYRTPTGQICSGEPIDVIDPVSRVPRGFCQLGKFIPVSVPKGTKF